MINMNHEDVGINMVSEKCAKIIRCSAKIALYSLLINFLIAVLVPFSNVPVDKGSWIEWVVSVEEVVFPFVPRFVHFCAFPEVARKTMLFCAPLCLVFYVGLTLDVALITFFGGKVEVLLPSKIRPVRVFIVFFMSLAAVSVFATDVGLLDAVGFFSGKGVFEAQLKYIPLLGYANRSPYFAGVISSAYCAYVSFFYLSFTAVLLNPRVFFRVSMTARF